MPICFLCVAVAAAAAVAAASMYVYRKCIKSPKDSEDIKKQG